MIYFCADDYGICVEGNRRIEDCLNRGVLNKISVLPNGEGAERLTQLQQARMLSLHINLVEGRPLSKAEDVPLLVKDDGCFRYSFVGLLLQSLSAKRKELERQLYCELRSQIRFWKEAVGENIPVSIDSHQHTHMIPLIFKTLMRVIRDEGLQVEYLRIPDEPLLPYIAVPSLYLSYSPTGLAKQWLLKLFARINHRQWKAAKIPTAYFMGVLFSGKQEEAKIKKLLVHYLKLAKKKGCDIEIGFHPGYLEPGEKPIYGSRSDFGKFYFSPWRKVEYDTLMNYKL